MAGVLDRILAAIGWSGRRRASWRNLRVYLHWHLHWHLHLQRHLHRLRSAGPAALRHPRRRM